MGYGESWPCVWAWPCPTSQPANQSLALWPVPRPSQPHHTLLKPEKASLIGLGKLLYNLTRQVYFSNYVLNILFIVYALYFKVDTLKTKTVAIVIPKMYQLFLIKDFVCVQLSLMVSHVFIACMNDI